MEGAGTTTIEVLPDEILLKVLTLLFGMTLMRSVPQVCKRWRKLCPEIKDVHLDFGWWVKKKVPLEVLAGWFQQQQKMNGSGSGGGDGGAAASAGGAGWASGMCELFPRTMGEGTVRVLAEKSQKLPCPHPRWRKRACT